LKYQYDYPLIREDVHFEFQLEIVSTAIVFVCKCFHAREGETGHYVIAHSAFNSFLNTKNRNGNGANAIDPLVAFCDIHGRKGKVLFFYCVPNQHETLGK
jgi:hypothetical protein